MIVAVIVAFILTDAYRSHGGAQGERGGHAAGTKQTEAKASGALETAARQASVETPSSTPARRIISMPSTRPLMLSLALAASVSLASGCATKAPQNAFYTSPADLAVEPKAVLVPEAIYSEAALDAYDRHRGSG
ncbi:hypothetical protein [Brevundimonas vesicularis]|uniref:hypothetical protein n=1 Tax=Brevundimonas vesicularis TaxID=41276 RepID=UPI0028A60C25|nr:hypothetical protein [Brevundimonas vesicularis]